MSGFLGRRLRPQQRIGPYRLLRPLDEGGQGSVWEAVEVNSREHIALKEFDKPDQRTRERIGRELQLCAEVEHEHLVRVFDVVEAKGRFWVAMSLAEGGHLNARVSADGVVTEQYEFAMVMIQIACALARIHGPGSDEPNFAAGGYAHRDVKPRNVMLSGHGSRVRAVLVDLSLITPLDGKTTSPLATIRYAAPEQLKGLDPNDRVDVYSLAATGFYMLTARPPHLAHAPPAEAVRAQLELIEAGPPKLSKYAAASWVEKYDDLFAEALSPYAERRPSALEFAKRMLAITWPSGAPYGVVRIPAELEPAALEAVALASPDPEDPHRPRRGLLTLTHRLSGNSKSIARQARIAERAAGKEEARPLYEQAAKAGDPTARAWLAQDREEELGPEAALDLWREADASGSAVAARRLGQIALAQGEVETAAECLRRAVGRRDGVGAFELHQLLNAHPDTATDSTEAEKAFHLALDLHHPAASRIAGLEAERRGELLSAERFYSQADENGDGEAAKRLAIIHGRRGEEELAESGFRRAVERGHGEALMAHADWAERMERYDLKEKLLWQAHRSGIKGATSGLARTLVLKDPKAARELIGSPEIDLSNCIDAITLASAELQLDRPEEAVKALAPFPGPGNHRLILATAHLAAGEEEQAGAVLDSAGADRAPHWILQLCEPMLKRFADRPPAGKEAPGPYYFALLRWEQAGRPQAGDPRATDVRVLFERGAGLGCAGCASWFAHLSSTEDHQRERLESAVALGSAWALVRLGELLNSEGDAGAARIYRTAVEQDAPEGARSAGPRYMLGAFFTEDLEEKEALLREADRYDSPYAWSVLASFLAEELGWRHPEIEDLYARADLRGSASAACRLGLILSAVHGDSERAEAAHRRAYRRSGDGVHAYNVGVLANSRGASKEAEEFWMEAAERGDLAAKAALAMKWMDRGEVAKAAAFAREAVKEADDEDVVNLFMIGRVLQGCGEHSEAADCFRRADEQGYAWASLRYSSYLEEPEAVRVLGRALEILDDDTSPRWYLISDRASLRRQIEQRLSALPRVGAPNLR